MGCILGGRETNGAPKGGLGVRKFEPHNFSIIGSQMKLMEQKNQF